MATEAAILSLRWHMAARRVRLALLRLGLALRTLRPRPTPGAARKPGRGGRWTDGDAGDGHLSDDARIIRIGDRDGSRYRVDLDEEGRGHTPGDHVGKTDDAMMQRVLRDRSRPLLVSSGRRRDGSFPSREAANDLVNRTLETNAAAVDAVGEGRASDAFVTHRFGFPTGREAHSTADIEPYGRTTYGVGIYIVHDARASRGYRVITAYLRNDRD